MNEEYELLRKIAQNCATEKELEEYKQNYMSDFEKKINKPFWKFDEHEKKLQEVYDYNESKGNMTGYDCCICKNKGLIATIKDEYVIYKECSCVLIRNILNEMQECGLGNILKEYTFKNFNTNNYWQEDVKAKALKFIDSDICGFTFLGQSGTGKTHLCTAIAGQLLKKGMKVKYMVWTDESRKLKAVVNDDEYSHLIDKIKNVDVLYIDDLFKTDKDSRPTSADIRLAFEIINYRYNLAKQSTKRIITIISSERTLDELREIDEATAGRINEMSGEYVLTIIGADKNQRIKV